MKICIAVDLEGVAGVVSHGQQCQWNADRGWMAKAAGVSDRLVCALP